MTAGDVEHQVAVRLHDANTDTATVGAGCPKRDTAAVQHQVAVILINKREPPVRGVNGLTWVQYLTRLHLVPLRGRPGRHPGVGRPNRRVVWPVDDDVAVILHYQMAPRGALRTGGPNRATARYVHHQVSFRLHDSNTDTATGVA